MISTLPEKRHISSYIQSIPLRHDEPCPPWGFTSVLTQVLTVPLKQPRELRILIDLITQAYIHKVALQPVALPERVIVKNILDRIHLCTLIFRHTLFTTTPVGIHSLKYSSITVERCGNAPPLTGTYRRLLYLPAFPSINPPYPHRPDGKENTKHTN